MRDFAPIILFVYNRPEHTKKVVEGLLSNPEAKDSDLYIFADGPKSSITSDGLAQLKRVRSYIHTISGFKNIYIDESDVNRGLANATIRGCTKVINKYGRMIMMEDDDVPNRYFLSYVNRALDKYVDDKRIWCVGGYTDTDLLPPQVKGDDLFLVHRPTSWGFGTWKRCWDKVVWDQDTLKGVFAIDAVCDAYDKWAGMDASMIMHGLFKGINSSWSVRYNFAAFLNDTYTILPNYSLIENIGCDGSGTHCGHTIFHQQMFNRDVIIPDTIKFDVKRNRLLWNSFLPSIKHRLARKLPQKVREILKR